MAWSVVISDENGANPVTLSGLSKPWPENPRIQYERAGSSVRMMPGWNSGSIVPGETVHFDFGFTESAGTVELTFYAPASLVAALDTKYRQAKPLRFSPNGGTTVYKVAWDVGRSFDPQPQPGFPGEGITPEAYTVTVRFRIIQKL